MKEFMKRYNKELLVITTLLMNVANAIVMELYGFDWRLQVCGIGMNICMTAVVLCDIAAKKIEEIEAQD